MNLPFKIGISPTLNIRGLIATRDIKKDSKIEQSPVILIEKEYEEFLEKTNFKYYYFKYDKKNYALSLGYISIVNHSFAPNCNTIIDYKNQLFTLVAIKNINKGDELTIEYMGREEAKKYPELFDFNKGIE